MKKLYKLNSKQQKLVKRLKDIIDQMDKNNIGAVLQACDVDFNKLYFYNAKKLFGLMRILKNSWKLTQVKIGINLILKNSVIIIKN